jgi:hypothetical protein
MAALAHMPTAKGVKTETLIYAILHLAATDRRTPEFRPAALSSIVTATKLRLRHMSARHWQGVQR